MTDSEHAPTVDDLRGKVCYICRESDEDQDPKEAQQKWVHPCVCTLIAHESCLLHWIRTSEGTARESNALQCPQCRAHYVLESNNPLVLQLFRVGEKCLRKVDLALLMGGAGAVLFYLSKGIYIVCTQYGAYALREYIGSEMYSMILSDDRSNWSLSAKVHLFFVPLGLISSHLGLSRSLPYHLLMWPTFASDSIMDAPTDAAIPMAPKMTWPPSPLLFGLVIFPTCQYLYNRYFPRFSHWVLGTKPALPGPRNENANIFVRFLANVNRRPAENNGNNNNNNNNQQAAAPPDLDPADIDAQLPGEREINVDINLINSGRLIGGALLIPLISRTMGNLLFRLSRHSHLIRSFLAIRPPWQGILPPPPLRRYTLADVWKRVVSYDDQGKKFKFVVRFLWGGTRKLDDCDPVWWRNSIGFGFFVVVKDCLHLLHLWLAKREMASRHVKSRDFSGVDPKELDLIDPTSPSPASGRKSPTVPGAF